MDSPLFIFSIRRIIVIIESVKSVENKLKVRHTKFWACLKTVDKKKKAKVIHKLFYFLLMDSISKRKLSSSSIKDLIFAWAWMTVV